MKVILQLSFSRSPLTEKKKSNFISLLIHTENIFLNFLTFALGQIKVRPTNFPQFQGF